ncbi:MazG-like family protein [Vreelandella sp.]|uniref:MazG-like family protein n=1 Tax=Vreelandella sp. TaxID=3137778 RepID=UPI003BAAC4CA
MSEYTQGVCHDGAAILKDGQPLSIEHILEALMEADQQSLTFDRFRQANNQRQLEWPGYEQTDTTFKALEVCGEAGELAEAVKKLIRAERGIAGSTVGLDAVADELADVLISADLLAAHLGIDLSKAVIKKFNKTSMKYGLETKLGEDHQ